MPCSNPAIDAQVQAYISNGAGIVSAWQRRPRQASLRAASATQQSLAEDLAGLFSRKVDLVSLRAVHPRLKPAVLAEARLLYAA